MSATVLVTPGHPANTIYPDEALGAAVDGLKRGEVARVYRPATVRAMLSAGFRSLTYRLRTELAIEAWHWSRHGRWSDSPHRQGYWISDGQDGGPITACYGYRLPRRGTTVDQANNNGYSRLDDGDPSTFWKSNPYLDHRFTHEADADHTQWVVLDLGRRRPINAIRILWADPYATQYRIEYWQGRDEQDINDNVEGEWRTFPAGTVSRGRGGDVLLRLSEHPVSTRTVRILMSASSGTPCSPGTDIRDRCGYAIREIYLGLQDGTGRFHDLLRHGRSRTDQTRTVASSTDPWHRACDRDSNIEQPGFDLLYGSGLTHGMPVLMPVGLLYDVPENGAATIRYLQAHGDRVARIEMGEEPDGQYVTPEDYGALYLQWADALHRVDPSLQLGGPCFQSTVADINTWPDASGDNSWLSRFLAFLQKRGRTADLSFFSFEWYPFDDLSEPADAQLDRAPALLAGFMNTLREEGLPQSIPCLITEYGYSSFVGRSEVEMESALLNAEIAAQFLTLGGSSAYLYGYEPNALERERGGSGGWGNLALFLADRRRAIRWPMPTYYAARLLTQEWAMPVHAPHELCPVKIEASAQRQTPLDVTGYAIRRPDSRWALLLINKSRRHAYSIRAHFLDTNTRRITDLVGPIDLFQYSADDYTWHPAGAHGHPDRDRPPGHHVLSVANAESVRLPPYSLTVLRGAGPNAVP